MARAPAARRARRQRRFAGRPSARGPGARGSPALDPRGRGARGGTGRDRPGALRTGRRDAASRRRDPAVRPGGRGGRAARRARGCRDPGAPDGRHGRRRARRAAARRTGAAHAGLHDHRRDRPGGDHRGAARRDDDRGRGCGRRTAPRLPAVGGRRAPQDSTERDRLVGPRRPRRELRPVRAAHRDRHRTAYQRRPRGRVAAHDPPRHGAGGLPSAGADARAARHLEARRRHRSASPGRRAAPRF